AESGLGSLPERGDLVLQCGNHIGRRADKHQPSRFTGTNKVWLFRQETVARVNRLGASRKRVTNDLVLVDIAKARAKPHALIGQTHMQRPGIGVVVERDCGDLEVAAGARDTYGDLATVSNQYLLKHHSSPDCRLQIVDCRLLAPIYNLQLHGRDPMLLR